MRAGSDFWRIVINANGNPSAPLIDAKEKIIPLKNRLDAKLPIDLVTLVSKPNGGHPEAGFFNTKADDSGRFEIA